MISNSQPYVAVFVFESDDRTEFIYQPVAAWDRDGEPLVPGLDSTAHRLRPAASIPGFQRIETCVLNDNSDLEASEASEDWADLWRMTS